MLPPRRRRSRRAGSSVPLHCVRLAWKEAESHAAVASNPPGAHKDLADQKCEREAIAEATRHKSAHEDVPADAALEQTFVETPVYRRNGKIHKSPRIYAVWMEWKYGYAKCKHRAPTDRTVYEWLRKNARNLADEGGTRVVKVRTPKDKAGDSRLVEKEVGFGPNLPTAAEAAQARKHDFETWARYLRTARKIEGLERQNSRKKSERRARRQ